MSGGQERRARGSAVRRESARATRSPAQHGETVRTFYHIVTTDPPTIADFMSNEAKGRQPVPRDPEARRFWSGISAYERFSQARRKAKGMPMLGRYVAELRIPEAGEIRYERTTNSRGHYTLWGDPETLLACVVSVMPL